jgi:hypothetical protein
MNWKQGMTNKHTGRLQNHVEETIVSICGIYYIQKETVQITPLK